MTKASTSKPRPDKQMAGTTNGNLKQIKTVHRGPTTGKFVVSKARFEAVMRQRRSPVSSMKKAAVLAAG